MEMVKVVLVALLMAALFCIYMLFRCVWVEQIRKDIKLADPAMYDRLPSLDVMVNHFWIWDASKFIDFKGIDYKEKERFDKLRKKEKERKRGQAIIDRLNKQ